MPSFQVLILVLLAPLIRTDCNIRELFFPNKTMDDVLINCMTSDFNASLVTLDMNNTFYIDTVKLDNRLDGDVFHVDIGTDCCQPPEFQSDCYRSCQFQNAVGNVQEFNCSDTVSYGRYLRVRLNQSKSCSGMLRVSDVHIFGCPSRERGSVNLALKKPAKQSSSYPTRYARLAVDGNSDGYFFHNSCSHTETETESWLEINLQIAVPIINLVIYNRVDCCAERLNNVDILLGRSQGPCPNNVIYETCATVTGVLGRQTVVNCTRRSCSQYVRIKLKDGGILSLCEVEVYGDYSIHDVPSSSSLQTTTVTQSKQMTICDTSPSQTTSDASPSQTTVDTSSSQKTGDTSTRQTASDPSQGQTTYSKDKFATNNKGTTEQFSQMSATFNRKYLCRCARLDTTSIFNQSQMQEIQKEIKNALLISRDNQSQQTRKQHCAQDNRKSAVGGGMLAIAILCIIPLVVIVLDCMNLVSRARELLSPKRITSFPL